MKSEQIPADFAKIYDRDTCQKCGKPITKERILDCKNRRFFPVCEECEKIIIPKLIKAKEILAKSRESFFK